MTNYNTISGAPTCSASGNVIAETAFGIAPANTVRATIGLPSGASNSLLDGRMLELRAAILWTTGTTSNVTPSIRLNSGGNTNLTTFTSDTAIITPAAASLATLTRLQTIVARLTWDVTTARLNGWFASQIDATFTTWATLTAQLTSGVASAAAIQFLITAIFGTTNASNTATLKQFELDLL